MLYISSLINYTKDVQKSRQSKTKTFQVPAGFKTVVSSDGEVLSESSIYKQVTVRGKSKFSIMFLDGENVFEALKGLGNAGAVWGFILTKYDKDTGVFYFNASVKDEACRVTGLSNGTVRASVASFCDTDMLLKVRNAEYMVNPSYFYSGYMEDRDAMIVAYEEKKAALNTLSMNKRIDEKTYRP